MHLFIFLGLNWLFTETKTLRGDLAKEQATYYLSYGNLSVESVSYLMGFSDVSSFRRGFKRWFWNAFGGRQSGQVVDPDWALGKWL